MSLPWSRSWTCSRCIKHQLNTGSLKRILAPLYPKIRRNYATEGLEERLRLAERTRNVGIIAHIDAGKTTTTERMLYYSGYTRRIGDVDDGSTVTDFLPAERARGITIQSAAITFRWPPLEDDRTIHEKYSSTVPHTINLIDTPGHADFTFEVVRSLRILDGAVCILDGVAGVEAQTEKVWQQAENYKIPKIIFVNKLDRDGATFGRTVKEIAVKLFVHPAVCQIPWYEKEALVGVVDVVELRALKYRAGGDGKQIEVVPLEDLHVLNERLVRETKKARTALVELLSEHDENVVEAFFQAEEKHLEVAPEVLWTAMRKCLLQEQSPIVPVFAGASFRNIGVQPILDAVNRLLPSPLECPDPEISMGNVSGTLSELTSGRLSLVPQAQAQTPQMAKQNRPPKTVAAAINIDNLQACALAFKVVNDAKRGVLIYVRVYHGSLERNNIVFNTNMGTVERMPRLAIMHANDLVEVESIQAGHIGVIVGLRGARTGDTLVTYQGMNNKKGLPEPLDKLQLRPIEVPPPVFFTSIVPHSLGEQKNVVAALDLLLREDPSLQVSTDDESGQMLLSGMGELHLEIARDRLINDFKAKASTGDIEIGYRETLNGDPVTERMTFDRELAGKRARASCTATVSPRELTAEELADESLPESERDANIMTLDIVKESPDNDVEMPHMPFSNAEISSALQNGALAALSKGPTFQYSMHNTDVRVSFNPLHDFYGSDSSLAAISAAARTAIQAAMKKSANNSRSSMMEPVMNVVINVDEPSLGSVVHDLTASRGAQITSLDNEDALPSTTSSDPNKLARDEDIRYIDPRKVYAPPDQFEAVEEEESAMPKSMGTSEASAAVEMRLGRGTRSIIARVPLKEMVGYLKYLRSLTKGRGTFVMSVDKFEKMTRQREKAVLKEIQGV